MRIIEIHMSGEYGYGHKGYNGSQSRHEKAKQDKKFDCPEVTQPKPTTTTIVPEKPTTTIVVEKPSTTTTPEESTTTAPKPTSTTAPKETTTSGAPSTTSTSLPVATTEKPKDTTPISSTTEQTTTTEAEARLIPPVSVERTTTTEAYVGVPAQELAMTGAEVSVPFISGVGALALGGALLLRQYAHRVSGQ